MGSFLMAGLMLNINIFSITFSGYSSTYWEQEEPCNGHHTR